MPVIVGMLVVSVVVLAIVLVNRNKHCQENLSKSDKKMATRPISVHLSATRLGCPNGIAHIEDLFMYSDGSPLTADWKTNPKSNPAGVFCWLTRITNDPGYRNELFSYVFIDFDGNEYNTIIRSSYRDIDKAIMVKPYEGKPIWIPDDPRTTVFICRD